MLCKKKTIKRAFQNLVYHVVVNTWT